MGFTKKITGESKSETATKPKIASSGFRFSSTAEDVTKDIDTTMLTAIVTGGSSGLVLETVRVLALRGAHVVIGARNMKGANDAKEIILKENPNARIDVLKLDLCSMKSVEEFVENFNALDLPLNILINNAGIMSCPYALSEDGVEMQFATNHLGPFHLTNLLLDKMKNTAQVTGIEGRIVNLSSVAHKFPYKEGIRFDNINDEKSYDDKKAYGQSKLASILHANELSRRLKEEGANITANSLHPGLIVTNLWKHSRFLMTATTCYVALHPSLKGVSGKYFADCNEMKPTKLGVNEELGKKLWDVSEKFVNMTHSKDDESDKKNAVEIDVKA
ncbi:NADP-retinol dehydrogenase [Ranunculus cassubicifolius]